MRKTLILLAFVLGCHCLNAQDYRINLHSSGSVIYDNSVSNVGQIQFEEGNIVINAGCGYHAFPLTDFDSITFVKQEEPPAGDVVYITYNGASVEIVNPYSNDGINIATSGANVIVNSTQSDVPFEVSGSSSNGSLTIYSANDYDLNINNLSLESTETSAINLASPVSVALTLIGTSSLADGANSDINGALFAAGNLSVVGNGTMQLTGNAKHGMNVDGTLTVNSGTIRILETDSDGIHGSSNLVWNDGTLEIVSAGSDGLDISGNVTLQNGNLNINTIAEDQRGIKVSGLFTMNGGSLEINHSGNSSKGIKADADMSITGGEITIVSSGSTVLETVNNQNVPAYCTAIKCDGDISITGGTFNITLPTTNHGGKSISADGDLSISGGDFTITTQGDGATYTISGSTKDAYTSSCLKCEGNIELLGGTFNLTSTGKGGKGINVGGTLVIGVENASNDDLTLNVTTTGERITVTAGGGGPWGGGDYANPKGIKAMGDLTINSGNITVNCTQSQNEGGECIESKAHLTINGGNIEAYSVKDDAVNAAQNITINGGIYYAHSDANDGTDSNGTMLINGGFLISNGSRTPEEGFDCDNNQFKITGSTMVGTGGGTSNPTTSVCTQPALKINTQAGYAIQILKSDGTVICTYQCPEFTGSGGGGWPGGGGGNGMVMLFSDPQLQTGQSYTVKYNGTISGGTEWHGYYTGNVTYSGGQSTNVNVNSMVTTVSAGGGGW